MLNSFESVLKDAAIKFLESYVNVPIEGQSLSDLFAEKMKEESFQDELAKAYRLKMLSQN
jgi:hypothetical protein